MKSNPHESWTVDTSNTVIVLLIMDRDHSSVWHPNSRLINMLESYISLVKWVTTTLTRHLHLKRSVSVFIIIWQRIYWRLSANLLEVSVFDPSILLQVSGVAKKMAMSKSFLLLSMMALVVAVAVADDALEGESINCVNESI